MIIKYFQRGKIPEININNSDYLLELRDKIIKKWNIEYRKQTRNEDKILEYIRFIKTLTNQYNQISSQIK